MIEIEVKYQACLLSNSLCRNINDNFNSISFEIYKSGDIRVKIILEEKTEVEDEYIYDMIAEFEASQQTDCVKTVEIEVGINNLPLKHLVYRKR